MWIETIRQKSEMNTILTLWTKTCIKSSCHKRVELPLLSIRLFFIIYFFCGNAILSKLFALHYRSQTIPHIVTNFICFRYFLCYFFLFCWCYWKSCFILIFKFCPTMVALVKFSDASCTTMINFHLFFCLDSAGDFIMMLDSHLFLQTMDNIFNACLKKKQMLCRKKKSGSMIPNRAMFNECPTFCASTKKEKFKCHFNFSRIISI